MSLPAQNGMNQILLDWGDKLREWEHWTTEAARLKGRRDNLITAHKTRQKFVDAKIAESWAKTIAESQLEVQQLNLDLLIAEANVEAIRKRLDWFAMRAKAKQSEMSTEREEAKVWASSPSQQ